MKNGIFISYRREDTRHAAARLRSELSSRFGAQRVFRDIDGIAPGTDFTVALKDALSSCAVLVALIGDRWLTVTDASGRRRIDDPDDWTAQEIVEALRRDVRVLPVLVDGVPPLRESDLPEALSKLSRLQALPLADARWAGDLEAIAATIAGIRQKPPATEPESSGTSARSVTAVFVAAAVIAATAWWALNARPNESAQTSPVPPNLSGIWQWRQGNEEYQIAQEGQRFAITVLTTDGTRQVGRGNGYLDNELFRMVLDIERGGQRYGNLDCALNVSADRMSMDGTCGLADKTPIVLTR